MIVNLMGLIVVMVTLGTLYLYHKVAGIVVSYGVLQDKFDNLEKEINTVIVTCGSIIDDSNTTTKELNNRVVSLEEKLAKYERAAKQVNQLAKISPRLARGATRKLD